MKRNVSNEKKKKGGKNEKKRKKKRKKWKQKGEEKMKMDVLLKQLNEKNWPLKKQSKKQQKSQ